MYRWFFIGFLFPSSKSIYFDWRLFYERWPGSTIPWFSIGELISQSQGWNFCIIVAAILATPYLISPNPSNVLSIKRKPD
jgi:hypothetical protein